MARAVFIMIAPGLAKLLGVPMFPKKPSMFLADIIERTYKNRRETGQKRNDIIDVVVEEMKKGELSGEFSDEEKELLLISQAYILFFAGFDSISIGLSSVINNLVKNQDIQDKMISEIDKALQSTNGKITYETIQNVDYVERVIQESGRYNNLFSSHERMCTKDYQVPDTNIVIPKGRMVKIFFNNIENDEKNFLNPNNFDPDNFLPENNYNKFAYMVFGQGPRACPAKRYALMTQKIFLVHLFRSFRAVASPKSNLGLLELDPKEGMFAIKGGVWLKLEKRI
jgi:cytochrome P450 family 6